MARTRIATVIVLLGLATTDHLVACGDKYLSLGLGTHYRRSTAERRAAGVLVYANSGSELARLMTSLSVEAALNKVGYRPAIAASPSELDTALRIRKWDVIVVDGRDTPAVVQRLQKAAAPHVVPVLTKPTKEELKQAEKTYDTVLNTPTKNRAFVDIVDDAMDLHEIEERAAAKAVKAAPR
ncbi:MAG TPA: hypothetical protein VFT47_05020 [Vicinamibacterales bacterium]|nr:hypothetical protein [Vicinamibacterales bacterium]